MEHVPFLLVNNEKLRTKETSRLCKRALYRYRIVKNNAFVDLEEDEEEENEWNVRES